MVVLIDTNIILDVLQKREPFFKISKKVLQYCASGEVKGYIAPHSISNLFFILRKQFSTEQRRRLLLGLVDFLEISEMTHTVIRDALQRDEFKDFEDCLQDESARKIDADYIITRNTGDYKVSKVPAIEPEQFVAKIQAVQKKDL